MFSGGLGHAAQPGISEAEVAADIAGTRVRASDSLDREPLARHARERAIAVAQLRDQNVNKVVIVTHGWHMPRAMRAFQDAAVRIGATWAIVPAPMGLAHRIERPALRWVPSTEGFLLVRAVLREKIGWWLGA